MGEKQTRAFSCESLEQALDKEVDNNLEFQFPSVWNNNELRRWCSKYNINVESQLSEPFSPLLREQCTERLAHFVDLSQKYEQSLEMETNLVEYDKAAFNVFALFGIKRSIYYRGLLEQALFPSMTNMLSFSELFVKLACIFKNNKQEGSKFTTEYYPESKIVCLDFKSDGVICIPREDKPEVYTSHDDHPDLLPMVIQMTLCLENQLSYCPTGCPISSFGFTTSQDKVNVYELRSDISDLGQKLLVFRNGYSHENRIELVSFVLCVLKGSQTNLLE